MFGASVILSILLFLSAGQKISGSLIGATMYDYLVLVLVGQGFGG